MTFEQAHEADFAAIQRFYWDVIDDIHKNNVRGETLGWEKGVYPSDAFLRGSLKAGELYTLTYGGTLCACVVLNSACNEGYHGCPWSIDCAPDEVLIPHALAVRPALQGQGVGAIVVEGILALARAAHKRTVRLDVLGACRAAERLYVRCGFRFVAAKDMFYEDTGWTEYRMFELVL